jgi:hypothetical protein
MTKQRWTVRSMDPAKIERVRSLQAKSGAGLGEIVSMAICSDWTRCTSSWLSGSRLARSTAVGCSPAVEVFPLA